MQKYESKKMESDNAALNKVLSWMLGAAVVWGLVLPLDWEVAFHPLSLPISYVANSVPSIVKLQALSPIPGAVRGVLAGTAIQIVIDLVVLFAIGQLSRRSRDFSQRVTLSAAIKSLAALLMYSSAATYFFWALPVGNIDVSHIATKGHLLVSLAAHSRLTLCLVGAIVLAHFLIFYSACACAAIGVFRLVLTRQ